MAPDHRVTVVSGPPGSGKNSYIEANARPGDRIVDFDSIMRELTGGDAYSTDADVRRRAREIRQRQIDDLLASGERGWIIATGAKADVRHQFDAEVVVLKPPIAEVLSRVVADRPAEFVGYVRDWYKRYEPDSRDVVIESDPGKRQVSRAELASMSPAEINAAREAGQLARLLAGGTDGGA